MRIVDSESRMDGGRSVSVGIPRQRHPGAEEPFGVVLGEGRVASSRKVSSMPVVGIED